MTAKISKNSFLSLVLLVFFLASCQNKTVSETQNKSKNAHDELIEKMSELYNSGKYTEFIQLAEDELKNSENDFSFYLALSDAYGHLNNFDKAFFYARKQLDLKPLDYFTLLSVGNYHLLLERLDSAEYYYSKVLSLNPRYARANINLAKLYEKKDEKDKAVEQYLKAIELFKENKLKDEVIHFSKEVLRLDPNNKLAKEYLLPPYL